MNKEIKEIESLLQDKIDDQERLDKFYKKVKRENEIEIDALNEKLTALEQ